MTGDRKPAWAVSPQAVQQATALGFTGDVAAALLQMFRCSTPFSHERGNRRYERYMLFVVPGEIQSISLIDVDPVVDAWRQRKKSRLR